MNCIFCEIKDYILENDLAYAIFDKFPATKGHMLIIPKRHVSNFFDITKEERDVFCAENIGKYIDILVKVITLIGRFKNDV